MEVLFSKMWGPDAQVLKKVSFQADSNQAAASVAWEVLTVDDWHSALVI